jgi:intraflagellar transport protein 172
LFDENG